jgi:hypothetical protein
MNRRRHGLGTQREWLRGLSPRGISTHVAVRDRSPLWPAYIYVQAFASAAAFVRAIPGIGPHAN